MKIYTRTGDQGETQLPDGPGASKGDMRFEALGELDELNSLIGWCRAGPGMTDALREDLLWVQDRIMTACAQLAATTTGEGKTPIVELSKADVARLEAGIDRICEQMAIPNSFIVPGGSEASCRLHLARTACRKAERSVCRCLHDLGQPQPIMQGFVNRLSDALFIWALYANHLAGVRDLPWSARSR